MSDSGPASGGHRAAGSGGSRPSGDVAADGAAAEPRRHDDTEPLPIVGPVEPEVRRDRLRWTPRRAALVGLLAALLAVLAVDAWLARSAEQRIAGAFEAETGAPAQVQLDGWPVGLRALVGRAHAAELTASDVPLEEAGATLAELEVRLEAVRVSRGGERVEADRAEAVARLDDEGVQELLGVLGRIPFTDLELRPGAIRVSVAGFPVADATARVDDGDVVFGLAAPLDRLLPAELRVDDLPLGFAAEDVTVSEGELHITVAAEPFVLEDRR